MIYIELLAAMAVFFLIYGYISNYFFVATTYHIHSDHLYDFLDQKPAIILSDLHNRTFGKNNYRLLDAIQKVNPACIIIAGDMVNNKSKDNNQRAKELVCTLALRYPIYYACGNHEQGFFSRGFDGFNENYFYQFFTQLQNNSICDKVHKDSHLIHLMNRYEQMEQVKIHGLMIDRPFYKRRSRPVMTLDYLNNLLGKSDNNCYNILIAHNPMYFKLYSEWGADLVISGHVHGGFVRLPFLGGLLSPQFEILPRYTGGLYECGDSKMILSRGLGTHTIPLRIFNPPQLIILKAAKPKKH